MLEVESWVISGMASAVDLSLFSLTLGSALIAFGLSATVVGFVGVVIASAIGAFIDDKFVDELNHKIIKRKAVLLPPFKIFKDKQWNQ
ncbi:Colicin-B [Escherichia coli]|nr:hypothetical protein A8F92_02225 [Escherichia coli]CAD5790424.1 Colicin-B [Escherichia coli]CAD5792430.1 Colicin-B [Escherichia coli]CAD5793187.1 Colicin-B [Escherichia coli]